MIHLSLNPVLFLLLTTTIDLNPPMVQSLLQSGLEFAYVDRYDSAQICFDKVIKLYPENPAGYFFKAALIQLKMMDNCQYSEEKEYFSLLRQATKYAEQISIDEDNLWAEFYVGSCYTYRAVYEGLKGNYFDTFKYGVKGGKILQRIINKDSTFYDAYLGAGSYEYFWARAARYLPVLKLAGGDVNEAIRKVRIAATKSMYSGPTAENSLAFIYAEEGRFSEAITIINDLLTKYPEGKTFLWNKADVEFKNKNYLVAMDFYYKLFLMYNTENGNNYSNLAQCKLLVGKCFFKLGNKQKAKNALKDVIYYKKHSDIYPKIKDYCREAYGLLSRIF